MSIKPDYFSLDGLLQKRLFRVPEYQRAYSWETKQRQDLFDDIRKLVHYSGDRHHFMATVVCLKTSQKEEVGTDEFEVFHIVDGQQRLTTLIILLKALAKSLSSRDDEQKDATNLNELLVKRDSRLILLQTNHDSQFIFRDYLVKGTIPGDGAVKTLAERNLVKAIRECEKFVQEWDQGPLSLLKIVKNRLDFLFHVIEDEGSVYTIFEVLNSRGLDVDWLDKCKSMLMGIAFEKFRPGVRDEHIKTLHQCWQSIYRTIGLRTIPGHEIIRFAATLKHPELQKRITSAEKAIEFFRGDCENNPPKVIEVSKEFLNIAVKLEQLYRNRRLEAVTDIAHARLLAVAIMLNESLNDQERKEILEQWERVTFRIFGLLQKDARVKVGDYTQLACRIQSEKMSKETIIAQIISIGSGYPISDATKGLRGFDCYNNWDNDDLRYFFYRYEEYLAAKQGSTVSEETWEQIWLASPTTTIEHIFPQTPDAAWCKKIGGGWEKYVNRLGNLTLLPPGVNSIAGTKPFDKKKEIYKDHRSLRLVEEILAMQDWNKKTIEEREKRLLAWAENTWG